MKKSSKTSKKREIINSSIINQSDVFLYICDAKRKITDKKCSGAACKYLKNGDCERTIDISYAKNEFNWRNFEFLEHREREGSYDYDVYSEKNSKGEVL